MKKKTEKKKYHVNYVYRLWKRGAWLKREENKLGFIYLFCFYFRGASSIKICETTFRRTFFRFFRFSIVYNNIYNTADKSFWIAYCAYIHKPGGSACILLYVFLYYYMFFYIYIYIWKPFGSDVTIIINVLWPVLCAYSLQRETRTERRRSSAADSVTATSWSAEKIH